MKRSIRYILVLLVTALMSSSATAAIFFKDDFESYPVFEGGNATDLGGGWTYFVNIFEASPGCAPYLYGYGPGPTPNGGNISNIVDGATGNALNVFSNYADGQHANGNCVETNVFQERILGSDDAGDYTFRFETQVPLELGADVDAYGFVKVLDPNNFSTVIFEQVSTVAEGAKFINVSLGVQYEGYILQWGFANVASNYEATGRWYDNVTFAVRGSGAYEGDLIGVPIPKWSMFAIAALLLLVGGARLRSRNNA